MSKTRLKPACGVPNAKGPAQTKASTLGDRRWMAMLGTSLFLWVLAAFWPSLGHEFLNYDDPYYVTENRQVQAGLTLKGLAWALTNTAQTANWHPVTWVSHMADCQLFSLSPRGHHFTSVLLHAVNTALLFLLLNRMTGARWRSFAVSALFGLHPLRVESVAWISERKDLLSGFFFLLTLWAYSRYSEKMLLTTDRRVLRTDHALRTTHHSLSFYLLALTFFALGLMSKPMLVTLPFVLLLLDWWPLGRMLPAPVAADGYGRSGRPWSRLAALRPLVVEKLPLFLLTGVSVAITWSAQATGGAIKASIPETTRLLTALVSYGRYLAHLVWPAGLSVEYYYPQHWPASAILASTVIVAGATMAALVYGRRRPYLAVGWFWYLGTLVPVIGLIQVGLQSMADRYTYIPSIGVLIAVIWGLDDLLARLESRVGNARAMRYTAGGVTAVCCLACFLLTRHQQGYWKNSGTLFRHALEVSERNSTAYTHLGSYLREQDQNEQALEMYQRALQIDARNEEAQLGMALLLLRANQRAEAIQRLKQALQILPNSALVHGNLGLLLAGSGRLDEAESHLNTALRLKPDYPGAHVVWGDICRMRGQQSQAIEHYQQALTLQPGYEPAQRRLKQFDQ